MVLQVCYVLLYSVLFFQLNIPTGPTSDEKEPAFRVLFLAAYFNQPESLKFLLEGEGYLV
jgi:hypothetical protein